MPSSNYYKFDKGQRIETSDYYAAIWAFQDADEVRDPDQWLISLTSLAPRCVFIWARLMTATFWQVLTRPFG